MEASDILDSTTLHRGYLLCWAHLVRKAQSMMGCYNKESQTFGKK